MRDNEVAGPIPPHGGVLVERLLEGEAKAEAAARACELPRVELSRRERCDLEMLAVGAFSPLEGFMKRAEFDAVVDEMHLPVLVPRGPPAIPARRDWRAGIHRTRIESRRAGTFGAGEPWTVPVTVSVSREEADGLKEGEPVGLFDPETGRVLAILHVDEKYEHDREREAREVYKTTDTAHPGVALVMGQGEVCLGGRVDVLSLPPHEDLLQYRLRPAETRAEFDKRGWRRVVAFQTRNPVHRAHEYLQKCALEVCDGILLHPLVGETQRGDVPAGVRMLTYEVLLSNYYPAERAVLGVLPASMRYAGPREAVLHAIMRKNYGCTHFIVGRDHAGVGDYYGTYDAQRIFDEFDPQALGITPMMFEHTFWCNRCEGMASLKTCPHGDADRLIFSGTKVRSLLAEGKAPPPEVTRPEVAAILIDQRGHHRDGVPTAK